MSKLSKNVVIYFIGNTVNRFMGIIVLLFATHILTDKKDIGFFNFTSNITNLVVTIFCFQIWMSIIRFVFDYKNTKNKLKVISTGYFVELISFLIYTIALIIYSYIRRYAIWFFFEVLFLSAGYAFNQGVQFSCRGLGKNKLYVISGIVGSFMQLVSSIVFLVVFNMTYQALILATAISYISQGLFIEFFLKSFKRAKLQLVDLKIMKKMIVYSIPTTLNFLAYQFNQSAYIWLLKIFYGDDAIGMFTPAFRMTSLIGFFVMSFNYAFQEYSFFINKSQIKIKMYSKIFNSFFKFITSGTILLLPTTCIFFSFTVGNAYQDSKYLLPVLYLASILDALQIFLGSIMQAEKKVISMFFSQLVGVITTIVTMNVLAEFLELQAAGVAMACCFFVVSFIRIISIKSKIKLKFNITYLIHSIPIYILTSYIYINYSEIVNFLYAILIFFYFVICNRNLIGKIILKVASKK